MRVLGVSMLAAVLAVAAGAATVRGPADLRLARPADAALRTGPAVLTQDWNVVAIDPRSRAVLLVNVTASSSQTAAQFSFWPAVPHTGYSLVLNDLGPPGSALGFSAKGLSLSYAGGSWTLALDQPTVQAHLAFASPKPGAAATRWPVGELTGPGKPHFLSTFNWAVPVATSAVTGSLDYEGRHVTATGWRGTIDQTWGRFDFGLRLMQHWDWAVVQSASDAWIVNGFETGAGITQWKPHDAQWGGVLIHAGAKGATFCRARAARSGWQEFSAGLDGYVYPRTLTASCNGTSVRFLRAGSPFDLERGWAGYPARTGAGGYGIFVEQDAVGG
jgi:hypothetical protein